MTQNQIEALINLLKTIYPDNEVVAEKDEGHEVVVVRNVWRSNTDPDLYFYIRNGVIKHYSYYL